MSDYPITRYLNVKLAYQPSFSSDGRYLAFISDQTGQPQAYRVPVDGPPDIVRWPDQLTFEDERVLWLQCSPAPGDSRILMARDRGGDENAHLYLFDPDTGVERCLTEGCENVMHIPGEWSRDGRTVLFSANRDYPGLFGLYRQTVDESDAELIWQSKEPGYLYNAAAHPDGSRVVVVRMGRTFEHDLLEVDLATGTASILEAQADPAQCVQVAYAKDGRSLYAVTDQGSDFLYLARHDLTTGLSEKLVHPNWDVEFMAQSPDGRYLAYAINEEGYSRLELIDQATGLIRPGPDMGEPGVIGWWDETLSFSADGRRLAFSFTSSRKTSDIYIWNLDLDSLQELQVVTRMPSGGIALEAFAAPELIYYPTFDGREIPAWFFMPAGAGGDVPVVVIVHGGPESQSRPYFHFLSQYLAHHGFAVLVPNVRGSTGYGKAYSHLDDVELRLDSVADLAHAAYWLRDQPGIDGGRIAVQGGSYGGFMVLAALAFYPELWAAGVDIVGISNFVTFLENTSDYRRQHRESEYGSLAEHREFLESVSPLNHAEEIRAPLLVIHGANDPRVPLSEAEQLVDRLREHGSRAELLVFSDEGHGISKLKNKLIAYPAIAEFLRETLA